MKHTLKRILAILISIMIAMPGTVFAEDGLITDVVIGEGGAVFGDDIVIEGDLTGPDDLPVNGDLEVGNGLDLNSLLMSNEPQGPEAAAFEQSAALDGVAFTVTAGAGVFPSEAELRVDGVDAEVARAAIQSIEATLGGEATHHLYQIQVLDAAGNPLSPNAGMALPQVRVEGLALDDGVRVFVYDQALAGSYEIAVDGAFSFKESGVYDIVEARPSKGGENTTEQPEIKPEGQPEQQPEGQQPEAQQPEEEQPEQQPEEQQPEQQPEEQQPEEQQPEQQPEEQQPEEQQPEEQQPEEQQPEEQQPEEQQPEEQQPEEQQPEEQQPEEQQPEEQQPEEQQPEEQQPEEQQPEEQQPEAQQPEEQQPEEQQPEEQQPEEQQPEEQQPEEQQPEEQQPEGQPEEQPEEQQEQPKEEQPEEQQPEGQSEEQPEEQQEQPEEEHSAAPQKPSPDGEGGAAQGAATDEVLLPEDAPTDGEAEETPTSSDPSDADPASPKGESSEQQPEEQHPEEEQPEEQQPEEQQPEEQHPEEEQPEEQQPEAQHPEEQPEQHPEEEHPADPQKPSPGGEGGAAQGAATDEVLLPDDAPTAGETEEAPTSSDPADGEPTGEDPLAGEDDLVAPQPVAVFFNTTPAEATVTVCTIPTEETVSEPVPAQADGSFALLPGDYAYTASAEGYISVENVPFTVEAGELPLSIDVMLAAEAAPEPVPFDQSATVDGVTVRVRAEAGAFPGGAALSVVAVEAQSDVDAAVEAEREDGVNVAASYTFDIKVVDPETGAELQPAAGFGVSVSFTAREVASRNLETQVYHVSEDGRSDALVAEPLDVTEAGRTATAETDGFSYYQVEFTYEKKQYVLPGDETVSLSKVLSAVGLYGAVTGVEVSNPDLFAARRDENGKWVVSALKPFSSEEWMKVTISSVAYEIAVTDDQTPDPVPYVDANGNNQTPQTCIIITDQGTSWGAADTTTWYAVADTTTIENRLTVSGDVNLILCDGKTLTATKGITVSEGNSLTVWAQSTGNNMGTLYAGTTTGEDSKCAGNCAGIGSDGNNVAGGNITINGGTVKATGGKSGAGIGGGQGGAGGKITINGGTVKATGGRIGAGIGGGNGGAGGEITVSGGTVTATGGTSGAGIGGGAGGAGGKITVSGGTVTATGGVFGAGIGGGNGGAGGEITVSGGTVTATGGKSGAGIGGGQDGAGGEITVSGGTVNATSSEGGAGIGCGNGGAVGTITVSGGNVKASGGESGLGFDSGLTLTWTDDTVQTMRVWANAFPSDRVNILKAFRTEDNIEISNGQCLLRDYNGKVIYPKNKNMSGLTFVDYVDAKGNPMVKELCTVVTTGATAWGTENQTTWYAVTGDVSISDDTRVTVSGDVNLILCDSATLTATKGITVSEGDSLTVWAQSTGNNMGTLYAGTLCESHCAGIGGDRDGAGGNITVTGGEVTAYAGVDSSAEYGGAGIGGGRGGAGGTITVNGGTVTATGGRGSAGIGDGNGGAGGNITIAGGKVTATGGFHGEGIHGAGGNITITGGTVTAKGEDGYAGIHGAGGTITLNWSATDSGTPALPAVTASSYGGNVKLCKDFIVKKDDGSLGTMFAATGERYVDADLLSDMANRTLVPCGPTRQITMNILPAGQVSDDAVTASVDGDPVTVAVAGQTVAVAVKSDSGYTLGSLSYTYTPEGGTETTKYVQADASGVYSFPMPDAAVTVNAGISPWSILQAQFNAASGDKDQPTEIQLTEDVTALGTDIALVIPDNKYVKLDLNGHVIDRALTEAKADGNVITVKGGLTVTDSAPNRAHDPAVTYSDPVSSDTVTVTGGVITGGNNNNTSIMVGCVGGGVYVNGGSFTMQGGSVTGNTAINGGGGVYVNGGSFTMQGGSVTGNVGGNAYFSGNGGGVYVNGGSFTMQGGSVTGNTVNQSGGGVYVNGGSFTMQGGSVAGNTAIYGGGVYVNGTFTMSNGSVTGNAASVNGGGVFVDNDGTFTMQGGSVTGNTASANGGGVQVVSQSATFNLSGGRVAENTANDGGGVLVYFGKFTMSGGNVTGNTASANGGGVNVFDGGTFTLSGGSVTGNTASANGGGVFVVSSSTFNLSGSPSVKDNHVGTGNDAIVNNVFLPDGKTIMIADTLADAASVGVTTAQAPSATNLVTFTSGLQGNGSPSAFTGDAYAVGWNEAGTEAALGLKIDVTATDYSGSYDGQSHGITVNVTDPASGATVKYGKTAGACDQDKLEYTDAGTHTVYYQVTVTGYMPAVGSAKVEIKPLKTTVTVTGATNSAPYDGKAHTVTGYTATAGTALYNVTKDFTFTGTAAAARKDAGRTGMGLAASQFSNTNGNFDVTFNVTDGWQEIIPITATVNIVGATNTADYDGKEHDVTGYTATASTALYDVTKDFTFSGRAEASRTDAGRTGMGLAASQFANTSANFSKVTFNVTDGWQAVTPINATVNVTGNTATAAYDGKEHTVSGYTVSDATGLYKASDLAFTGTATATRKDAGKTAMGLGASQFSNISANFTDVTFNVTDGWQAVTPINATVNVTGNTATAAYDGNEHTVTGYTVSDATGLYKASDLAFTGTAAATRKDAGRAAMGLGASQFSNISANFTDVTFNVTDGWQAVNPITATVTVTGATNSADYDGEKHTVSGYTAKASTALYDVTKDFTFTGTATAARTDAGKTAMGLAASQFKNTNANFSEVTFNVTDGWQAVMPITATVTVTGATNTADYDGEKHTVSGYTATASTALYDVTKDFTFTGTATAARTDAGKAAMGLAASQFKNTNANFSEVTFNVTDGWQEVTPITATVTVTGATNTADYDGEKHTVSGYTATASTALYDVTKDFTFTGTATAVRKNAGKTAMGLKASQFENTSANFSEVTFKVTDGWQEVNPITATVTVTGKTNTADYDGKEHTITGYTVKDDKGLYKASDLAFTGTAAAARTDAGKTAMGLAASQFENTNANFSRVTFKVTDGWQEVTPITATVTVTGATDTADYDGKKHTVSGYTAKASTALYDVEKDFTFTGKATAARTDAGKTAMGLEASQFENTSANFSRVTFKVTDGWQEVTPITATVTVTGATDTADYDGKKHTVSGYTAKASTALYDVEKDFTFTGKATAARKDAGKTAMGLAASQFENTSANFSRVTFKVTDGWQKVTRAAITITADDKASRYGTAVKKLTYAVGGDYVAGDDLGVRLSTTATKQSNVGSYPITVAWNGNPNYRAELVNGVYTVTRGDLAVTAKGYSGTYDGKAHGITVDVGKSKATVYYGTRKLTGKNYRTEGRKTSVTRKGAGETRVYYYVVGENYEAVSGSKVVEIKAKPLTVQAKAASKVQWADDPRLTYTVSGLVKGEKAGKVLTGALARQKGEAPGKYQIRQGSLKANKNYELTFKGAVFTIKPRVPRPDATLLATVTTTDDTATLTWTKVAGAEGYDVFFRKCDGNKNYPLAQTTGKLSCTIGGLKKGGSYKAYVRAWKTEGKEKVYLGKAAPTLHFIAGGYNGKNCDAKAVNIPSGRKLEMSVGGQQTIRATVTGVKKDRDVLHHLDLLRYYSSDRNVATVDATGVVKAKGRGECEITVIANNGVSNTVTVKVK